MKRCALCKKKKNKNLFALRKDGYFQSYCRICKREDDRNYQRRRRSMLIGYKADEYRKYRKENPQKVYAQQMANRAMRNGIIKKVGCEVCGAVQIHMHHDDYSKPLKVRFLCPVHHKAIH